MSRVPRSKIMTNKYKLSKYRHREMYYYALQYNEWKDELKYKYDSSKAIQYSDMPKAHNVSSQTEEIAIKCAELQHKIEVIESAARLSDAELYKYILKAVTNENIDFNYLQTVMGIPCSKNTFYDRQRKFYWILSQNLEKVSK